MLGADLIALNHSDYVRHFTNACTRILGLEVSPSFERGRHGPFDYEGRLVAVEICPAGIDPNKFAPKDKAEPPTTPKQIGAGSPSTAPRVPTLPLPDGSFSIGAAAAAAAAATPAAAAAAAAANLALSSKNASLSDATGSFEPSSKIPGTSNSAAEELRSMRSGHVDTKVSTTSGAIAEARLSSAASRLAWRFQRGGGRLVVSLDRLDWSKGLPQKLVAMEAFFTAYPEWRKKVTFLVVVRDQPGRVDKQLRQMVAGLVGRVNGRFGGSDYVPVHYVNRTLSHEELVAVYGNADVALITSIREGINLSAMEFVAAQSHNGREEKGVLIYSEFAGCASSLKGATIVNPFDAGQVADAVHDALTLRSATKRVHHHTLVSYVSIYTSELWATRIMAALTEVRRDASATAHPAAKLDLSHLRSFYERSGRRLLVLDYDGALATPHPLAQLSAPSEALRVALQDLSLNPANAVVVLTGRRREDVEEWFSDLPHLTLVADHGYWMRPPARLDPDIARSAVAGAATSPNVRRPASGPELGGATGKLVPSLTSSTSEPSLSVAAAGTEESLPASPPFLDLGVQAEGSLIGDHDEHGEGAVAPRLWRRGDLHESIDLSWMGEVLPFLEDFTLRTPGSYLEASDCALTWHYRDADADFGAAQAKNLQLHFDQMLRRRPVRVTTAPHYKYMVLQPIRVTKGRALAHLLKFVLPELDAQVAKKKSNLAHCVPKFVPS